MTLWKMGATRLGNWLISSLLFWPPYRLIIQQTMAAEMAAFGKLFF